MKISTIEKIIDSIEPYFLIRDMGIKINEVNDTLNENYEDNKDLDFNFFSSTVKQQQVRILPCGFLNMTSYTDDSDTSDSFIAGTGLDLLAFYFKDKTNTYNEAYTKAFGLFFKHYGSELRSKLLHEPTYVEKLVKNNFIKRHITLDYIVKRLKSVNNNENIKPITKAWLDKNNIKSIKGFAYVDTNENIYKFLSYLNSPSHIETDVNSLPFDVNTYRVKENSSFGSFINNKLFKNEYDNWIVVPYFADYHILNSLKFINPKTDETHTLYVNNCKVSYAGVYNINPRVNFTEDTIRILPTLKTTLTMFGYNNNQIITRENNQYVHVDIAKTGDKYIRSNLCMFKRMLFLNEIYEVDNRYKSDVKDIKVIYDSILNKDISKDSPDLYICDFKQFAESNTVYTYDSFVETTLKNLMTTSHKHYLQGISPELEYILNVFDVYKLKFKHKLFNWLKENNYHTILSKIAMAVNDSVEFNKFVINITANGYLCSYKDKPEDMSLITNFIFKIDQSIIYKNSDEIMYVGRMLMGEESRDYPIVFYKKDLARKDCIESIALKAFSYCDSIKFISNELQSDDDIKTIAPIVFDSDFNKHLLVVLKHEINKAPCKYGEVDLGWDKLNGSFTSLAWKASALNLKPKSQFIYALTTDVVDKTINKEIKQVYTNMIPNFVPYNKDFKFLNTDVRDILSVILAYLYRSYLGYNVKPFYIQDNVKSRNLVKFIFLALGQIAPVDIPSNLRLLKSNMYFKNMNGYPFYARGLDDDILVNNIKNLPCVLFLKDTYKMKDSTEIAQEFSSEHYKQLTSFALDTFSRFFKWVFTVDTESFDFESQVCKSNEQLISEGNIILRYLFWSDVKKEYNKDYNAEMALKYFIANANLDNIYQYMSYSPEYDMYVLRRATMAHNLYMFSAPFIRTWSRDKILYSDPDHGYFHYIDKAMFDKFIENIQTKDKLYIDTNKFKIFVLSSSVRLKNALNRPIRTMEKAVFDEHYPEGLDKADISRIKDKAKSNITTYEAIK